MMLVWARRVDWGWWGWLAVIVGLLLAMALGGCAGLGLESPKTFQDRLAYAYGTNTAVREASTSSLNARKLSSADVAYVKERNDEVRRVLDAARLASEAGDVETAEGRLAAALKILTEVQSYLRARGVQTEWRPEWATQHSLS
jgi:hypothetical protein